MSLPPCHEAARRYLERGWSAAAFCDPQHIGCGREHARNCKSPGKRPLGPWKGLQILRQPPWMLDVTFRNHPNANVGVVLGEVSKLVGLDVDGPGGRKLLEELSGGRVPPTLCFLTGKGIRLLYGLEEGELPPRNRKLESPGGGRLEVLGNGTTTVMPPSRHPSGKEYRWAEGYGPGYVLAPVPSWVHQASGPAGARHSELEPLKEDEPITSFRNERLFRIASALRRHGVSPAEIFLCLRIINRRCVPPLEEPELRHIARSAGRYRPAYAV